MSTRLFIDLTKQNDLNSLYDFINDLEAKDIGVLGGRKFKSISGKGGEIVLNDLIQQFYAIVYQTTEGATKSLSAEDATKILDIRRKIYKLDQASNVKLIHKNLLTRLLTNLRSAFGSAPLYTTVGLFPRPYSREEALQGIAKCLEKEKKRQYLAEEFFDEANRSISNEDEHLNISHLKEGIITYIKNPSDQFDILKNFYNFSLALENEYLKREYKEFIKELIYKCRHIQEDFIKNDLAPILVAAYSYAHSEEIKSDEIPNIVVYLPGDEEWSLKSDPDLKQRAISVRKLNEPFSLR